MGVGTSPCCMFPVCDLQITDVLLLVLQAAAAKLGLDIQEIYGGSVCEGNRGRIRGGSECCQTARQVWSWEGDRKGSRVWERVSQCSTVLGKFHQWWRVLEQLIQYLTGLGLPSYPSCAQPLADSSPREVKPRAYTVMDLEQSSWWYLPVMVSMVQKEIWVVHFHGHCSSRSHTAGAAHRWKGEGREEERYQHDAGGAKTNMTQFCRGPNSHFTMQSINHYTSRLNSLSNEECHSCQVSDSWIPGQHENPLVQLLQASLESMHRLLHFT